MRPDTHPEPAAPHPTVGAAQTTTVLAINDYRRDGSDPGTVYVDAINVQVRASFEPLPEGIGSWPLDVPQVCFTLDAGRERPDVHVWMDTPSAAQLRAELERVLSDPRCDS